MSDSKIDVVMGGRGVQLNNIDEAFRFASAVAKAGLAPKSMQRPEQILVAMQVGMEVGMSPMRALNSVVVINGAPTWKGDAAAALILRSGLVDGEINTRYEGEGDERTCIVSCMRGRRGVSSQFSVADAKRAGLWGKSGPWTQYPDRMLYYRALGFMARDHFADVLYGFRTAEEALDIPAPPRESVLPAEDPLIEQLMAPESPEPASPVEVEQPEPEEHVGGAPHPNDEWIAAIEDRASEVGLGPIELSSLVEDELGVSGGWDFYNMTHEQLRQVHERIGQ